MAGPVYETANSEAFVPDWAVISHQVLCPLCEYDLRGLREARCPECGGRFSWDEVLNPRRQEHPYLFEHHPERNAWSFLRTALGACRPRRFWRQLHPVQKSRPLRLVAYWVVGALCLTVVSSALPLGAVASGVRIKNRYRAAELADLDASRSAALIRARSRRDAQVQIARIEQEYASERQGLGQRIPRLTLVEETSMAYSTGTLQNVYLQTVLPSIIAIPLAWAWLTFLAMLIFRWSMRRARVKRVHLLRCVLYSFDPLPLAILCAITAAAMPFFADLYLIGGLSLSSKFMDQVLLFPLLAWIVLGSLRLSAAVRLYLQFDHPRSTVLATQVIVLLVVLCPIPDVAWQALVMLGIVPR